MRQIAEIGHSLIENPRKYVIVIVKPFFRLVKSLAFHDLFLYHAIGSSYGLFRRRYFDALSERFGGCEFFR